MKTDRSGYPSWRFHHTLPNKVVRDRAEDIALDDDWQDTPYTDDEAVEARAFYAGRAERLAAIVQEEARKAEELKLAELEAKRLADIEAEHKAREEAKPAATETAAATGGEQRPEAKAETPATTEAPKTTKQRR